MMKNVLIANYLDKQWNSICILIWIKNMD